MASGVEQPAGAEPAGVRYDPTALDEIELTAEVIVAANEADAPLSADDVDRVLRVRKGR